MWGRAGSSRDAASYSSTFTSRLARPVAASLLIAFGLAVLWQAGLLSRSAGKVDSDGLSLAPAEISLETEHAVGLSVGLKEGNVAPNFEFSSFDGERLSLAQFRGRPVLLNFWATWCIPCRAELPDMQALLIRYEPEGFAVLAMNNGESYKAASAFIKSLGVRLTAFGYDPRETVAKRYGVQGLPTSYFIDSQGVIAKVVAGQLSRTIMESGARAAIDGSARTP